MMVTVAKSIDAPIKLVFPRPEAPNAPSDRPQYAMLGLGDVVLPGIMIGLALRFDLFLFYLRRQKRTQVADGSGDVVEKPIYHSLAGRWSDHFWSHSFLGYPLWYTQADTTTEAPFTFPKTYFTASLVGYVLGMFATLAVMHIWGHAQPALLYLVPGVLGSLWLTAMVRGELRQMWNFSEESEDEGHAEAGEEGKAQGRERESIFSLSDRKAEEREERMKKVMQRHIVADAEEESEAHGMKNRAKATAAHRARREVFSFSVEAPWELKKPRSFTDSKAEDKDMASGPRDVPQAVSTALDGGDEGHAGKRARLK